MNPILLHVKAEGCPPHPSATALLTCQVEVVTPMFLAGADQAKIAREGLRSASVKASLRWWWRALEPTADPAELAQREGALFGDTTSGQGLSVRTAVTNGGWDIQTHFNANGSQGYLLGQGLFHFKDGVTRPSVAPGSRATIVIDLGNQQRNEQITPALELFCLFGGLGARSRRGFGALSPCGETQSIKDRADYRRRIDNVLKTAMGKKSSPEWANLGKNTKYVLIDKDFPDWPSALDALGKPMQAYRQSLGGMKAPYGPDHDLVSDHLHKNHRLASAPLRAAFGIPHNYFFRVSKKKLDFHWDDSDRRASPLLLHVARLATGKYAAVALLVDGPFLPPGKSLITKPTKIRVPAPSYQAIHAYLDLLAKGHQ